MVTYTYSEPPHSSNRQTKAQETNFNSMPTLCQALILCLTRPRERNQPNMQSRTLARFTLFFCAAWGCFCLNWSCFYHKFIWLLCKCWLTAINMWRSNWRCFLQHQINYIKIILVLWRDRLCVCRIEIIADPLTNEPYGAYSYTRLCILL